MSELRHGERRVPHSRVHVGWHACSARMRSQACMQRGARADAFAEACEPILRLKFKLPVSAPRNGFIIGVFLLMCPPCLHRQSSPPCAQFDHRHLLVRVLRHRCPRAARPCSWSFRPLPCPQSCNFRPLLRKDGRIHYFEKRSVIMSHLKYEIERIRHDPHDKLLKSSPFCSEPAAAVSITCQETPSRTASLLDEAASRTNDINDRKRFTCDGTSSPVFFLVTTQLVALRERCGATATGVLLTVFTK